MNSSRFCLQGCLHRSNLFCQVCLQQLSSASPWVWFGASPQSYTFDNVWSTGRTGHFECLWNCFISSEAVAFCLLTMLKKWTSWTMESTRDVLACACYIFSPCFCSLVCRHFVAFLRLMFSNRNRGHRLESKLQSLKQRKRQRKASGSLAFWGFWFTSSSPLHSIPLIISIISLLFCGD